MPTSNTIDINEVIEAKRCCSPVNGEYDCEHCPYHDEENDPNRFTCWLTLQADEMALLVKYRDTMSKEVL